MRRRRWASPVAPHVSRESLRITPPALAHRTSYAGRWGSLFDSVRRRLCADNGSESLRPSPLLARSLTAEAIREWRRIAPFCEVSLSASRLGETLWRSDMDSNHRYGLLQSTARSGENLPLLQSRMVMQRIQQHARDRCNRLSGFSAVPVAALVIMPWTGCPGQQSHSSIDRLVATRREYAAEAPSLRLKALTPRQMTLTALQRLNTLEQKACIWFGPRWRQPDT